MLRKYICLISILYLCCMLPGCSKDNRQVQVNIDDNNQINMVKAIETVKDLNNTTYLETYFNIAPETYNEGDSSLTIFTEDELGNPEILKTDTSSIVEMVWAEDGWNKYQYTISLDTVDKESQIIDVKKDNAGNYYIEINNEGEYFIYFFDSEMKFISKIKISNSQDAYTYQFYVMKEGIIVVQTYFTNSEKGIFNIKYQKKMLCNKLSIYDLNEKMILWSTVSDSNFGEIVKVNDQKIVCKDTKDVNLLIIDSMSGNIEKTIDLSQTPLFVDQEFIQDRKDSMVSFYEDYLYILKKSGLYRLNIIDGTLSLLLNSKDYAYFSKANLIADYFVMKNEKEFYIIGYSGQESSSDFYKYAVPIHPTSPSPIQ